MYNCVHVQINIGKLILKLNNLNMLQPTTFGKYTKEM